MEELISRADAAKYLGISGPRLTQLTTAGEIIVAERRKEKSCYVHYYRRADIEALKVKRENQPEQRGRKKKTS